MDKYNIKRIRFYINYETLKKTDLDNYKYIILKYLYGNFKFIKINNENNLFFENNVLINSSYFNKFFVSNNNYFEIKYNFNENQIYILENIICCEKFFNPFFDGLLKQMQYNDLNNTIKLLEKLDLCKNNKYKKLEIYLSYIKMIYQNNLNIDKNFNIDNVKIQDLIHFF